MIWQRTTKVKVETKTEKNISFDSVQSFSFAGKPVYWKDQESKTISSKRTWISKMQRTRYIEKYPEDIGNWIFQGTLNQKGIKPLAQTQIFESLYFCNLMM